MNIHCLFILTTLSLPLDWVSLVTMGIQCLFIFTTLFLRSIFVLQKCHRSIVRSLLFFVHVAYCFLLLSIVLETSWTGTPGNCPFFHQIGSGLWRWAFTVCSFLRPSLFHQVRLGLWWWAFTVCSFLRPFLLHQVGLGLWRWAFTVCSFLRPSLFHQVGLVM